MFITRPLATQITASRTTVRPTWALLMAATGFIFGCNIPMTQAETPTATPATDADGAPRAAQRPYSVPSPNGARLDEYYWLRDDQRRNPQMLDYLQRENAYADRQLANTQALQAKVYDEIIARLQQDDASVPYRKRGYWYYSRYETGKEYPIYARRKALLTAPEEVLLDVNTLASGHDFFQVGDMAISPNGKLLAWAEDSVGRRQYVLKVMEIATRRVYPIALPNVEDNIVWAADNQTFFYIEKDAQTLLGIKVRQHRLDSSNHSEVAADPLVWQQTDDSFYTHLDKTKDEQYLLINTKSTVSSEVWYAAANAVPLKFKLFLARERDHEYDVEHANRRWIVRTNYQAKNFRIVSVKPGDEAERSKWRDVVATRDEVFIDAFAVARDFLSVELHAGGLRKLLIRPWTAGAGHDDVYVTADEPSYTMELDVNREFDSDKLRYTYTSMVTPRTTYEYDFNSGRRALLKREPVLGGYDPAQYTTEFVWATARDGARVPVSLVYANTTPRDGTAPLLQIGYGAYGVSYDPEFSYLTPSLLDRGFIVAIAHIRGGQELGRAWYENGRQLHKRNTFTDFIDVTRWLAAHRYHDPRRAFASGRSAGGLLMGAVANLAPQDYRGIIAGVPFVDVVTTMLDQSIPLTTNEFDEWGNPQQQPYYDYMLTYSPYDNLAAHDYPALFVRAGLWDSQVQYFEPAKYVARLRARRTGNSLIVLRTNMEAGHGGKSGRYEHYREYAEEYAFLLDQAGIHE